MIHEVTEVANRAAIIGWRLVQLQLLTSWIGTGFSLQLCSKNQA